MPDDIQDDLAEALAKLQAARDVLTPLLDTRNRELAPGAVRLERMAAEVTRIERAIAKQAVAAGEP